MGKQNETREKRRNRSTWWWKKETPSEENTGGPKRIHVYPFAGADYIYLDQDGYEERGAGSLDLKVDSKRYDMLRHEGGIGFAYVGCFSSLHFLLDTSVSYAREFRFLGKKTRARFEHGHKHFTVRGLNPKNNLVCPAASIGIASASELTSLTLGYHGEYGSHFHENEAEVELKFSF